MAPAADLCAALLVILAALGGAAAQGDWRTGRATFFGIDGWSIHKGACGLGYQYKELGTGWDVAALADASPEFSDSCGRCFEVRCDPRWVTDGYGNMFDRTGDCKAGDPTVVLRIVDACPCVYPGNAYSNARWCCGDNKATEGTHFDMSIWAFEKIASVRQGLAAIQYRPVPCDFKPPNPAPDGPTTMPDSEQPANFGAPGDAFSPGGDVTEFTEQLLVMRSDSKGAMQGAVRPKADYDTRVDEETVVSRGELLAERGGGTAEGASSTPSAPASEIGVSRGEPLAERGGGAAEGASSTPSAPASEIAVSRGELLAKPGGGAAEGASSTPSAPASEIAVSRGELLAEPGGGAAEGASSGSSGEAGCADVIPPGQASCSQQKEWGKCRQGWMLAGDFCAATCGRCSAVKQQDGQEVQAFAG